MLEHLAQRLHFVNAFAGENAFAIEVLVDVRDRAGIDIEAGLTGIDAANGERDAE